MKNINSAAREVIYARMLGLFIGETISFYSDTSWGKLAQGVAQDHNGQQVAKWSKYSDRRFRSFKDSGYVWIVRTR